MNYCIYSRRCTFCKVMTCDVLDILDIGIVCQVCACRLITKGNKN